ncbi:hypothetical protein CHELA40_10060 [Chelatococcus asaccharovorans]|nr:hypothetical protein CHELA40_10060 [Chelatococcus asaccharovorans]CAH1687637.1 hypothetical protein CHELA17_65546 [Chelatococcus asaccharovorans]
MFGWLALPIMSSYIGGLGCDPYTSSGERAGPPSPSVSGFVRVSPLLRVPKAPHKRGEQVANQSFVCLSWPIG